MKLIALAILLLSVSAIADVTIDGSGSVSGSVTVDATAAGDVAKDSQAGTTVGSFAIGAFSTQVYRGTKFTAGSSYTMHSVTLRMGKNGSPTMNMTASIYTHVSNSPGSILTGGTSGSVACSGMPSSEGDVSFTGLTCSITSGTTYWIIVHTDNNNSSNYPLWYWASVSSDANGIVKSSSDGSSWSTFDTVHQGKFTTYGQ